MSAILYHIRKMKASNIRDHILVNHLMHLTQFGKWCKIPFTNLTEKNMLEYSEWLGEQTFSPRFTVNKPGKDSIKKYSDGTKYSKIATVKVFLKNINPDAAKCLKLKSTSTRKLPEDLLTKEDIEALIDNCANSRDRALIATLYESGMRKGELFSIRIKHIHFDENGTVVNIPDTRTTKTGARRIRIIFATEFLKKWLEDHPCKNDREHLVFCSLVEPHPRLTDAGLRDQLTKIAGKAGIKKRVNPHSFRHARATHMSSEMTEQQLKKYLGWTEGSNMAAVYVHLSGKDLDDTILRMNGMKTETKAEDHALKTLKCPKCGEIQDARNDSCCRCWTSFKSDIDNSLVSELQTLRDEIEQLKQSLTERDNLESHYRRIVNESLIRARGEMLPMSKEFAEHEERMAKDQMYVAGYTKFVYLYGAKINLRNIGDQRSEHIKKLLDSETEIKTNTIKTLDKLFG
jgi:integrase/recombinase XerD